MSFLYFTIHRSGHLTECVWLDTSEVVGVWWTTHKMEIHLRGGGTLTWLDQPPGVIRQLLEGLKWRIPEDFPN